MWDMGACYCLVHVDLQLCIHLGPAWAVRCLNPSKSNISCTKQYIILGEGYLGWRVISPLTLTIYSIYKHKEGEINMKTCFHPGQQVHTESASIIADEHHICVMTSHCHNVLL